MTKAGLPISYTDLLSGALNKREYSLMERIGWVLFAVLLCTLLLQAGWILAGHPQPCWFTDSVFYLSFADFYAGHFKDDVTSAAMNFYRTTRYPPLFPLSLAVFGGGVKNSWAAYWVTLSFALLALVFTFTWYRQQSGNTLVAALLLPVAILSPEFFYLHLEVLSESQFIFLLSTVFVLVYLYERKRCSLASLVLVACVVPLSRTAGMSLLVALTVWLGIKDKHTPMRTRGIAILVLWTPAIAWALYRRLFPVEYDYFNDLSAPIRHEGVTWLASLLRGVPHLVVSYSEWFSLNSEPLPYALTCLLLFLSLIGWSVRFRAFQIDAFFLPIYVALIAAWPYPNETARLLTVTMPTIALCAWDGLTALLQRARRLVLMETGTVAAALVLFTLGVIASSPQWIDILSRANEKLDPELKSAKRSQSYFQTAPGNTKIVAEINTRIVELSKQIPATVPATDCVWTSFYGQTAFLTSFRVALQPTPPGINAENAKQLLSACRYLLITSQYSKEFSRTPLYPAEYVQTAKPVLYSDYMNGDKKALAAALLDLRR